MKGVPRTPATVPIFFLRAGVRVMRAPSLWRALEVGDERFDRLIGLHDADQAGNREQEAAHRKPIPR